MGIANSSARMLPPGAVVFTRDATIGEAAITTCSMAVSQHIIAWICDDKWLVREYLLYAIYAMASELSRLSNGATIGTIGLGDVKELRICVPPITEQTCILAEMKSQVTDVDLASRLLRESVKRLQEYRSALITAAVTGQIDGLR